METKYSFIVPVYNVENYMRYCIDSLLAQTYKSFEIIIVDDESKDTCGQIAEEYKNKYPQYIRVVHQKNTGLGGARNSGIDLSNGEYILFVDGDDYVSPQMLEIVDEYLKKNDDDILFFESISVKEKEIGRQENIKFLNIHHAMSKADYVYQQPSSWRKVYKSSLFKNKDLRFPTKIYYEDLALAPCFVLETKNIGVIEEKLYYYVKRSNSIMHSKDVSRLLEIIPAFDYAVDFFKKNGLITKYDKELEWLAIQHVLYFSTCRISMVGYLPKAVQKLFDYMNQNFPSYVKNPYIGMDNIYIKLNEINILLEGDYKKFDKEFFYWIRKKKWLRDNLKRIFIDISQR